MNKALYYFNTEYHFTEQELIQLYGEEYHSLIRELEALKLLDPKWQPDEKVLYNRIDNFMADQQVTKRKRRAY